jgi:hypothetical protein
MSESVPPNAAAPPTIFATVSRCASRRRAPVGVVTSERRACDDERGTLPIGQGDGDEMGRGRRDRAVVGGEASGAEPFVELF